METKFKKGDQVQATRDIGNKFIHKGLTGTVMDDSIMPLVQWNDKKVGSYPVNEDDLKLFETEQYNYDIYHYEA